MTAHDVAGGARPGTQRVVRAAGSWTLAAVITALACAAYLRSQGQRELMPDEGIYSYVGWAWAHGDALYRDAWDHKGPVVFAVTALRTAWFGNAAALVGAQEIALGVLTSLVCAASATCLWGSLAGAFTLVFSTIAWTSLGPAGGQVSTSGSIIALLGAIAVLLAVTLARARSLRIALLSAAGFGLVEGLLFAAKPNAIVTLPLFLVALAARPAPRRGGPLAGVVVAGFLFPIAFFGVWFAARGTLHDALETVFTFNALRGAAAFAERGWLEIAKSMLKGMHRAGILAPLVAVGLAAMVWLRPLRAWRTSGLAYPVVSLMVPGWILLELIAYGSNGAYFHHLFPLFFGCSLGITWLLVEAGRRLRGPRLALGAQAAIALLAGAPFVGRLAALKHNDRIPPWRRTADYLRATTAPNERILQFPGWTSPPILFTAERKAALRYMSPLGISLPGFESEARWAEFARPLEGPHAVRTVLADLSPRREWATPDSLARIVTRLDGPFSAFHTATPVRYESRERAKQLLLRDFRVEFCDLALCVLRRKKPI